MIKFDLTAILYSKKNYDIEYKLHKICQNFNINLVTVLDFVELTIKSITIKPKMIFCDCATINFSSSNIMAFMQKDEFKKTRIIFLGNQSQTNAYKNFVGKNIGIADINELPDIIDDMQSKLLYEEIADTQENELKNGLSMAIYKLLCSIGFSAKHCGCAYLRECIKNVVLNNGVIHALASDQYPYIAATFKTNIANVERNIRNCIDCAWKNYGKDNWHKVFFSKSMQLGKKPTNREFIYMCSEIIASQIKYNIRPNYDTF
ncbi:MAG: sporulation initiation factor Spo0A C-terminal domain-containing protein [Christensenellales bacterium]